MLHVSCDVFRFDGFLYRYDMYADGYMKTSVHPTNVDPTAMGVIAVLAIVINVVVLSIIIKRSKEQKKNPYKNEIFVGTRDYEEAMARAEIQG